MKHSNETGRVTLHTGNPLKCLVCQGDAFSFSRAQLNTAEASFFGLDWANESAGCFTCIKCGYIHWFKI